MEEEKVQVWNKFKAKGCPKGDFVEQAIDEKTEHLATIAENDLDVVPAFGVQYFYFNKTIVMGENILTPFDYAEFLRCWSHFIQYTLI